MPLAVLYVIGGFGLCLLAFAIALLAWNRSQSAHAEAQAAAEVNPLLVANEVRNDIENIEWLTELLLKQEFGKLKIAQIELIDEIRRFSDHAAKQTGLLLKKEQNGQNIARALFSHPQQHPRTHTDHSAADGSAKG